MGQPEARVTGTKATPKATRSKRGTSGAIKPEHIETWMVQAFAFTAMMKNARHWAISEPEIEVRPWAGSAAELANTYMTADHAQKLIAANAFASVAVGISIMVSKRMQLDAQMQQQARLQGTRNRAGELRRQEGLPPTPADTATVPQETPVSQNGQRPDYVPGSGAQPTPADDLPGFNVRRAF